MSDNHTVLNKTSAMRILKRMYIITTRILHAKWGPSLYTLAKHSGKLLLEEAKYKPTQFAVDEIKREIFYPNERFLQSIYFAENSL